MAPHFRDWFSLFMGSSPHKAAMCIWVARRVQSWVGYVLVLMTFKSMHLAGELVGLAIVEREAQEVQLALLVDLELHEGHWVGA